MSVNDLVNEALRKARATAGGHDKTASASPRNPIEEAIKVADALEYMATEIHDAATPEGAVQRSALQEFFAKQAGKGEPAQSVAPTGTQGQPPQSGARKILPEGLAKGSSPAESGAPTGTQATIGQPPGGKEASAPRQTLLDVLTKRADGPSNSPTQSTAGQDAADPGKKNENANVDRILGSNEAPVSATKRDAKLPTRERLKALFASASDTGPSSAAAQAAFPQAYAKGGMKVADADDDTLKEELARRAHGRRVGTGALIGAGALGGLGALASRHGPTAAAHAVGGGVHGALAGHFYDKGIRAGYKDEKAEPGEHGAAHMGNVLGTAFLHAPSGLAHISGRRKGIDLAEKEHERQEKKDEPKKEASLADYANLFDKAASGELGDEAKAFAELIEQIEVQA